MFPLSMPFCRALLALPQLSPFPPAPLLHTSPCYCQTFKSLDHALMGSGSRQKAQLATCTMRLTSEVVAAAAAACVKDALKAAVSGLMTLRPLLMASVHAAFAALSCTPAWTST